MARFGGQSQQRWGDNTLNANEYMRDLMLTDLSGKPVMTADARRKGMLVLAFFAPNSPVSQTTVPYLQRLADVYKESGKLTVIGVALADEEATRAFGQQYGITFPLLMDRDRYHAMLYGVTSIPTAFLADGSGLILRKFSGFNPSALNEISARVAAFAEVEAVPLVEKAETVAVLKAE